jgi:hypothetical protein
VDLTDVDIEKITTPLWERAKAEIEAGRVDAGVALLDEAVSRWHELQYFYVNRLASLLSFIAEELGEEAVERALRATGERFIRARRDTGVDWGALPATVRAKVVARAMLANFGEVDVSEDDEKVVLSIRCGTGGRLVEEGRYDGDDAYVTLRERAPRTFMLEALPVYCAHCSINNEIQPIEWGGVPISVEHPVVAPDTRCIHHLYKDVHGVPDEAYERIGMPPPSAKTVRDE